MERRQWWNDAKAYLSAIRKTSGQTYGLKWDVIGNMIGEYIGNMMGTHWELEGNMLETKEKWKKSPSTQTLKEK
jgi:hypothetical protein